MKNNTAIKRRNHVKQGRMVIVAELYKKGWNIRKIADEVRSRLNTTCSTRTVWNDIQDLLKEWRETRIDDMDTRLQLELERIDDCVSELWEQWEKSKEDWIREHNKKVGVPVLSKDEEQASGDGATEIVTVRRENMTENVVGLGNPAYIAEIRNQLAERRKLLGLYAATRTEITGKDGESLKPDPVTIRFIADREQLEKIEAEVPDIKE